MISNDRSKLISTHAITGNGFVGLNPNTRADGFTSDDFSGCLDAPDYIAAGSSRSFEWSLCGEKQIITQPTFFFRW